VIVLTLGWRFGLADETRIKERGQRELLDAVADTYLRGRMTTVALAAVYEDVDTQVRRALKLPKNAPDVDRDARLPREFADVLHELFEASLIGPKTAHATAIAEKAYNRLGEFLLTRASTDLIQAPRH
jgi:hypothetical protein